MKSLFSSRRFVIILFLIVSVSLAACERQLDQEGEATNTPAPAVLTPLAPATTDPLAQPTTDPLAQPTVDPLAPQATIDPAAQPTVDPNAGAQVTPATTGQTSHVVQTGETLFSIALQYNLTVEELANANNIDPNGILNPGQTLIIPAPGTVVEPTVAVDAQPTTTAGERNHIVQAGENLYRIGLRYGFSVEELAAYNGITNPDRIDAGQVILIPPGGNP